MAQMPDRWDLEADLVALGSSSGGLTAALVGRDLGLSTVVLEKDAFLGGGTAVSGGVLWAPLTTPQLAGGIQDSTEEALTYIRSVSLGRHDEAKARAYVEEGPKAVGYVEKHSHLTLARIPHWDDYYRHAPGAKAGRSVGPDPDVVPAYLAEREKKDPLLKKVRPNLNGMTWPFKPGLGGGRSIIGALVAGCSDRKVPLMTETPGRRLIVDRDRVVGVEAHHAGKAFFVKANKGVLIATGGFEHNQDMNKRYLPAINPLIATTPPSNTGDGVVMGMEIGADLALMDSAIWMAMPVTLDGQRAAAGGSGSGTAGSIVVNRFAKRCANESFYPGLARAVLAQYSGRESTFINLPMYTIMDSAAAGANPAAHLKKAETIEGLAKEIGLDPQALRETVDRFNHFARMGKDPDFGRGEYPYPPQPGPDMLAPLEGVSFYAGRIGLGNFGTKGGLLANQYAQVISVRGMPIPGLYAASNAAASTSTGMGYSSGQANSNSMVFGWIAARHIAQAR